MNLAIVMQKPMNNAKTRLKHWLSSFERISLVHSMLFEVCNTLSKVPSIDRIGIVTSDPTAVKVANQFGAHVFYEREPRGMNAAIKFVVDQLPREVNKLLIFPADIPLISIRELSIIIRLAAETPVTIIPCRNGTGTNGLILSPPDIISTAFGVNSMVRHCMNAQKAGVNYSIIQNSSLAYDIDTVEDLLLLKTLGEGTKTKDFLENNHIFEKILPRKMNL
ncbi:2-phospho-L-lactate guanylyltransferase [Paenibacillus sp. BSR1-1]|uniref:2-phospho-L-lactate guanylyltransferase n=1 Tax=Paenibacillus sp. BSR1-1 TaxID=3020845 RepID=UPI0025AFCAE8|nr:2-phospho-L-lactate guanylyltransferase [Paenibacillus sp. BSR1-1]MDN3016188.1 2-phospho-L-lactate guanylyltransferase [Paenibacillus sp. BSR1-1]